jgi:hypothetical protein
MIQLYKRMAGVNYARYPDRTLYNQYLSDMNAAYPGVARFDDEENLYDASYFLLYSLAYASMQQGGFTGTDVANGMLHLVHNTDYQFAANVGPQQIPEVVNSLYAGDSIALDGTLGPPDFDVPLGVRHSQGSVYCVQPNGTVDFDVLLYQPASDTLQAPDGGSVCSTGL